jgi:hypothetical protein
LFSEGWNTKNGEALKVLVHLSFVESHKEHVFNYLIDICPKLAIQLKLVVLHEICFKSEFSEKQLFELFQTYTEEITSEVYHVAGNSMSFLFYHYFNELIPFVEKTMDMPHPQVAKSLGAFLLYGWFYGYEKSKDLLFQLHRKRTDSIEETIQQAFQYYKESEYKEKCKYILDTYIDDDRKEIHDAFANGFYQLSPKDFLSLKDLILKFVNNLNEERIHGLYSYLIECACYRNYAQECLEIQKLINEHIQLNHPHDIIDPIKLITTSYNAIGYYNTGNKEIEYAMDVFDELLEKNPTGSKMDGYLEDVDRL